MDASEALEEKLPGFAGYAQLEQRRLTDREVRAYLGGRLAALADRLAPTDSIAQRMNALILRTEFANQVAFRGYENATLDAQHTEAIAAADLATVEIADRTDSVFNVDMLPSYLDAVEAALNARDRAMEASGTSA